MNWSQLKTILWLRWRLTRNQWTRGSGLGAVLAVAIAVGAVGLGGLSFLGGLLGGWLGMGKSSAVAVMGIWFGLTIGFLFFWMIGLLTELQRSETIDLQRLMHLPVALGQIFVVNYLVSHLALSIVVMVPAMLGLALGLAISRGPILGLTLPLALSMVFMITAWTYYLRGWLATLMSNPRRRRAIIMGITLAFILIGQAPNLYFNVIHRNDFHRSQLSEQTNSTSQERQTQRRSPGDAFKRMAAMQKFIPPFWVPVGAQTLAEGRVWPALLGTLGCLGLGALGLQRAYRSTIRFYHGDSGARASARISPAEVADTPKSKARRGTRLLERQLPLVPEQAAALALATFRSMLRAPEVKMAWATSFLVTVILGVSLSMRTATQMPAAAKPFIATGAAAFAIFMLIQFLANQFGFDRDGFRSLILAPADRRLILLGKNLASLPVGALFGVLLIAFTAVRLGVPLVTLLASVFQLVALLLLSAMGGNVLSILMPYRIQQGSMKPTKMPAGALIVMVLCQLLFPVVMLPVFVPPLLELVWRLLEWPTTVPINLLLSMLLAGLTVAGYWWSLHPLGRLLQQRETKILQVVSVEVE